MKHYFIAVACAILVSGCSGSSSLSDNADDGVLTGIFLDSAVSGVSYTTETQSGTTNGNGEFQYMEGEFVTFSIGTLVFPEVMADAEVSPVDMSPSATIEDNVTLNIARLLQSMDIDNNPRNGITISDSAGASAALIDFSQSFEDFTSNTDVINLVANSGSSSAVLVSPDVADAHLRNTLGMDGFVRIVTLEEVIEVVVDRVLLFDTGERVVVRSDNQLELIVDGVSSVGGTWIWENSLLCREVEVENAPLLDCQIYEVSGNQLRFTREAGAGESIIVTVTDEEL